LQRQLALAHEAVDGADDPEPGGMPVIPRQDAPRAEQLSVVTKVLVHILLLVTAVEVHEVGGEALR
jgi:hypothetical protein